MVAEQPWTWPKGQRLQRSREFGFSSGFNLIGIVLVSVSNAVPDVGDHKLQPALFLDLSAMYSFMSTASLMGAPLLFPIANQLASKRNGNELLGPEQADKLRHDFVLNFRHLPLNE